MNKEQIIFKNLVTRRSIRRFKDGRDISQAKLNRVLQVAQFAPNACNLQALEYVLVKTDKRKKELSNCISLANNLDQKDTYYNGVPACYIVCLLNMDLVGELNRKTKIPRAALINAHYISVGCSLANMTNQIHAEGLGSCIVVAIDEKIRRILNLADKYLVVGVVLVGYPAENPKIKLVVGNSSTMYFQNKAGRLVVPKRKFLAKTI